MRKLQSVLMCAVIGLLVMTTICACGKKEESAVEEVARPVKAMIIHGGGGAFEHEYPGKTEAAQVSELAFQTAGKLIELPVKRGQVVVKGDLLARIDPRDFENELNAKNADFTRAKAELERYRGLYEEDAVSLSDLEVQERNFDVAKASFDTAQKALDETALYAPFDGVVARLMVDNFQNVSAQEPVLSLQNSTKMEVTINIPENHVVGIPQESREFTATAEFDALRGKTFPLEILEWEAEADPTTQTFLVKFLMDNPADLTLRPGMTTRVNVAFKGSDAADVGFLIPSSAIFASDDGEPQVWVINQETMRTESRAVVVEDMMSNVIRVESGVQAGEQIVTAGVTHVRNDMKVRVVTDMYRGE